MCVYIIYMSYLKNTANKIEKKIKEIHMCITKQNWILDKRI